jgi:uncharacterized protein YodC (DUF2158 family)
MPKFKIGDVVRTREDSGPTMCVLGFKGKRVRCRWWKADQTRTEEFDPATIMHVSNVAGVSDEVIARAATFVSRKGKT